MQEGAMRTRTSMRRRTFELLEVARPGDRQSHITDIFIVTLIITNAAAVVFGTVDSIYAAIGPGLLVFEWFSVAVFSIEYLLRLWSVVEEAPDIPPTRARLRYAFSWLGILDLLAVVPAYLPLVFAVDLRILKLFRLFRLVRLLKIGRYSGAVGTFAVVLRSRREELAIAVGTMMVLLLISSTVMYFVEHNAQPDEFANIPDAMWWAAAALTSVGYGDVYPITVVGRIFGALPAILGIGLFALPAGILAAGFAEVFTANRVRSSTCPTCGRSHEDDTSTSDGTQG
ncbi:MAG: ion transporter [Actinobacteria bacterium]|nr:ion transporter [Actinomycetota bacterium]